MTPFAHQPVLLEETLSHWITDVSNEAWYVDGTLGGGGHAYELLSRTNARLLGVDRDREALKAAGERLKPFGDRLVTAHGNHRHLPEIMAEESIAPACGILLDLGVSSYQFDAPERGFSYQHDAPLDMRMDASRGMTAGDVVNGYPIEELARILYAYGEERYARRIAQAIVRARPVRTTAELADIVKAAMPAPSRYGGGHPARRTFQALRIEVNEELSGLDEALDACLDCLKPKGRLCVITFHSLEDRIVKRRFRLWENPCTCPPRAPKCTCGKMPMARAIDRHGVAPGDDEVTENPRARSARLRVVEKT